MSFKKLHQNSYIIFFKDNPTLANLIFLVLGVGFDAFTLSPVDSPWLIMQNCLYLILISEILFKKALLLSNPDLNLTLFFSKKLFAYHDSIYHFLIGSLLSTYLLYYLKSASLFSSLIFILLIASLTVINELPFFHNSFIALKAAAFQFCFFSFFIFLIPLLIGKASLLVFFISIIIAWSFSLLNYSRYRKYITEDLAFQITLIPSSLLFLLLVVLYIFKFIPPLPFSLQYIGVYRQITKQDDKFKLLYYRSPLLFWQNGDQSYVPEKDKPIYVFARIYSPKQFSDTIYFHWQKKKNDNWQTWDKIPATIAGGRQKGFRVYVKKQNFEPGLWRVKVISNDDRELGRIYIDVKNKQNIFSDDVYKYDYE